MLVFGGLLSIFYLYLFNRNTRQSLHDVVVSTYVVNAGAEKRDVGDIWRVHLFVVSALFIMAAVVPAFTGKLAESTPFKEILSAQSALSDQPGVNHASVSVGTTSVNSSAQTADTSSYISAQVFLIAGIVNDQKLAQHLATVVVENYPEAREKGVLRITLAYGYDIGIWSQWSSYAYDFNPKEI